MLRHSLTTSSASIRHISCVFEQSALFRAKWGRNPIALPFRKLCVGYVDFEGIGFRIDRDYVTILYQRYGAADLSLWNNMTDDESM